MKKYMLLLVASFLISCSEDNQQKSESSEYIGKWGLSEILMDPGDGSGVFQPVDTFASIEFLTNGTVSSNYSLCSPTIISETAFVAPYNADSNLILPDCLPEGSSISYSLSGAELILYYPCVEACAYKFVRIDP